MAAIQDPTAGVKLQSLFGIVGKLPLDLSQSITPVVLMDDLTAPAKHDKVAGGITSQAAAGVGNYSYIDLVNPASSKLLIFCDYLLIQAGSSDTTLSLKLLQASNTISAYCYYRDARQGGQAVGGLAPGNAAVVAGNQFAQYRVKASAETSSVALSPIAIITPGTCFRVAATVDNLAITCSFLFRERPLS